MAFLRQGAMKELGREFARSSNASPDEALRSLAKARRAHYDIFLSQTIKDAEIVLGVYVVLTRLGFSVFCDWVEAPSASRDDVTPANAAFIRDTMAVCDTLMFLDSENADQSLWMCWELGWFDGAKGLVAVLPVLAEGAEYYRQREFLGLYPYVEFDEAGKLRIVRPVIAGPTGRMVFEAPNSRSFEVWKSGVSNFMRPRTPGYGSYLGLR